LLLFSGTWVLNTKLKTTWKNNFERNNLDKKKALERGLFFR
jgi:hypothetical protein